MSEIDHYLRAQSVEEACIYLQRANTRPLAGGTDLLLRAPTWEPDCVTVIDIHEIPELCAVSPEAGGLRIGAAARLSCVMRHPLLQGAAYRALVQGAGTVGSPQVRNLATLGGNLCNAAPSADTAAPLLALAAEVEIASPGPPFARRRLPLAEFFQGPGRTALQPGELLTAVLLPEPPVAARSLYLKLSPRRAMDLAFVGVAALLAAGQPPVARLALSAVAPTPLRLLAVEAELAASALDRPAIERAAQAAAAACRPISDVRASADYRRRMVATLTRRALLTLLAEGSLA